MNDRVRRPEVLTVLLACCLSPWLLCDPARPGQMAATAATEVDLDVGIEELLGDWGAERSFRPAEAVRLVIQRTGMVWTAAADGERGGAERRQHHLEFSFPSGAVLRLYTGDASRRARQPEARLLGHWLQPPGVALNNTYATPVAFEPVLSATAERDTASREPAFWRGSVEPPVDRLTFGLRLERDSQAPSGVRSLLRNPERNVGLFLRLGAMERDGDTVRWLRPDGQGVALEGRYHANTDTLSLHFAFQGLSFDFTRRLRAEAPALFPRPDPAAYSYGVPLARGDGWPVAHARERGFDLERLEQAVQRIAETRFDSLRSPQVHSLLIARGGALVLDESFHGHHAARPHDTRSSAKSLTAVLAGLAMDAGAGFSMATPLADLFDLAPDPAVEIDPRKQRVTVGHALSMNTGFDCDDNDGDTPGNEDAMQSQQDQPDWVRYTLDLPMERAPGVQGVYCTAGIHLLSGVLEQTVPPASGMSLLEWIHRSWMQPLQIDRYHWNLSPVNRPYFGGGVRLRPRDHLKMGQVVLDDGLWQGERVLSADWVGQMTASHSGINRPDDYGYGWWRETVPYGGAERRGEVDVLQASGNGGQLVIVIPELDLVIGFTGGNYGDFRTWISWLREFVPQEILPALKRPTVAASAAR